MLKLEKLVEMIRLTLFSAYIVGEQPVSLLISAKVEAGKTELVKLARPNRGILYLNDATALGIMRHYAAALSQGEVRHIIIPDLLIPLSKQKPTVDSFVSFLNALIEEGVIEIRTAFINIPPMKKEAKCGLITTIAPAELKYRRKHWLDIGFLSRLVPVSYSYSVSTIVEILNSISEHEYYLNQPLILNLPSSDIKVSCEPRWGQSIIPYTQALVKAQDLYGFRLQKQLQRLMMASALERGKDMVFQEDFDRIVALTDFINLEYATI